MHTHGLVVAKLPTKSLIALGQLQIHLFHACRERTVRLLQRVSSLIKTSECGAQQFALFRMPGHDIRHSPSDLPERPAVRKLVRRNDDSRFSIGSSVTLSSASATVARSYCFNAVQCWAVCRLAQSACDACGFFS